MRRYLRWLILSMRNHTLDAKDAAVMGQLGSYLLKAVEALDFDDRIATLERTLAEHHADDTNSSSTTH